MLKKILPNAVALVLFFALFVLPRPEINIILSPHYDDASLSLGGYICSQENKSRVVVVTFFSGIPNKTFSTKWDRLSNFSNDVSAVQQRQKENQKALNSCGAEKVDLTFLDYQYRQALDNTVQVKDLEKQIEIELAAYPNYRLKIFGPAYFGDEITHPDHALLHQAFLALALKYQNDSAKTFFVYEDFPYILKFNNTFPVSLNSFLNQIASTSTPVSFQEKYLPLSVLDLQRKVTMINDYQSQTRTFNTLHENVVSEVEKYAKQRCLPDQPICEVAYQVVVK